MNLIPTRRQWNAWTLPSKASYAGCVLGVFALLLTGVLALFSHDSDRRVDQPQLAVRYSSKPYLRYVTIAPSGLEFSYEICVKNSGTSPAAEMAYTKLTQALVIDAFTIANVEGKEAKNPPPQRLVSGEHYCQIFTMSNTNMTAGQISNFIRRYNSDGLAIILELEIEYKDAITGKRYSITERNKVFKEKVQIL